jgi:hypothetical protein
MRNLLIAFVALSVAATPAFAAPTRCKDAKGRFMKCPAPAKSVRCKTANGKFAKCGTPGAKAV